MTTIEEFHKLARTAIPGAWVKTTIEQTSKDNAPRFVVFASEEDDTGRGEAFNVTDAINQCRRNLAQSHADKDAEARRRLGIL